MSTKAIRDLLASVARDDGGSTPRVLAVLKEVEAIERAAKGVVVLGGIQPNSEAMALMESIAKDAP